MIYCMAWNLCRMNIMDTVHARHCVDITSIVNNPSNMHTISHNKSELKYVDAFTAQEVIASEVDAHECQRQQRNSMHGGLHFATFARNELATRLHSITKGDGWLDISLKMQVMTLPINVHMSPEATEDWRNMLCDLEPHLMKMGARDDIIMAEDMSVDIHYAHSTISTRRRPVEMLQAMLRGAQQAQARASTPTWRRLNEEQSSRILGYVFTN